MTRSAFQRATSVDVYTHPDKLPPDVQRLFADAESSSVELGVAWFRNFVDTVKLPRSSPKFYVLNLNGVPVAALPVFAKSTLVPGHSRVDSLTHYYTALYAPVLAPGVAGPELAPLFERIISDHSPMGEMRFAPMDPLSDGYAAMLQALRLAGMLPFRFFSFGNWYLKVPGSWTNYLAHRHGQLRNTIKRMEKKLAQESGTIEVITGVEGLQRGLAAYQQVYSASWKNEEPFPEFVPGLIATAAAQGWLRLGVVWLGGRPIAAQLWMVSNGKAEIYKLAYDEAFKAYSPGSVLTAHLMQHVFEKDHVQEVDYLIGDDPYKKSWMSDRRERWGIVAYNPRTLTGLWGACREASGRAVKPWVSAWRARFAKSPKP